MVYLRKTTGIRDKCFSHKAMNHEFAIPTQINSKIAK